MSATDATTPEVHRIDCETGEETRRPLTEEELAVRAADIAASKEQALDSGPSVPPAVVEALRAGTATPQQVQAALAALLTPVDPSIDNG